MTTMTAAIFDTLIFAKKLKAAGFNDKQAEAQAELIAEVFENNVATKQDIKELEHKIETLNYKLTIRFGLMSAVIVTLLAAIIKL